MAKALRKDFLCSDFLTEEQKNKSLWLKPAERLFMFLCSSVKILFVCWAALRKYKIE